MSDSDEEGRRLDALRTVRTTHSGAEYESGEVHRRRGLNEETPGVDAVDGREEQSTWSGGHENFSMASGQEAQDGRLPEHQEGGRSSARED